MEPATQRDRFIWLEAIDRPRNIARRYAIALSQDLFGSSIVEYSWGRIGTRGQARMVSFAGRGEADRFVAQLLRRRAGAPRRIGVAYRAVAIAGRGPEPSGPGELLEINALQRAVAGPQHCKTGGDQRFCALRCGALGDAECAGELGASEGA
jgi:predicted DNA-binding WGR domain protein